MEHRLLTNPQRPARAYGAQSGEPRARGCEEEIISEGFRRLSADLHD